MIKWSLQTIKLKDLHKHPSNPRTLSKEQYTQLKKSIDKFGLIDKIVINPLPNGGYVIIGGHQRFEILKKDKVSEVECWVPDRALTDDEVKELMVRHNKNTGSFDFEVLANDFNVPDLLDWGFTPTEMELVFDEIEDEPKDKKAKKKNVCPNCGHEN